MRNQGLACLLTMVLLCLGYTTQAQRYHFPVYGTEQGFPSSHINGIDQDSLGYLWIATNAGVSQFDGISSKNYTEKNGLSSSICSAILCDSKNQVWVAHRESGISVIKQDTIIHFNENNGLANNEVNSLFEAVDGTIWVGTFGGASSFDGTSWTSITKENGLVSNNIHAIGQDSENRIWLGTYGAGINIITKKAILSLHQGSGLANNYVTSIGKDPNGKMVIGTLGGISVYGETGFETPIGIETLQNNQVNALSISNKSLWLGTFNGLSRLAGSELVQLTEENGLPSNEILSVFTDKDENTWAGTKQGLTKIRNLAFGHYSSTDDVDIYPTALLNDSKGQIWAANEAGGALKFNGYSFEKAFDDPDINDHQLSSICEDDNGNIWFGTMDFGGLFQWTGEKLYVYSDEFGLADNNINCLYKNQDGILYIGTPSGLSRFDGVDFEIVYLTDELTSGHITAITSNADGVVYLGALDGSVFRIDDDGPEQILSDTDISTSINDLKIVDGSLQIATNGQGLFIYQKGVLTNLDESSGLRDMNIMSITTANSHIYLGCKSGLQQLVWNDGDLSVNYHSSHEGLVTKECKRGAALATNGSLWLGTTKGIVRTNTTELTTNIGKPSTFVQELQLSFEPVDWAQEGYSVNSTGLPIGLELSYKRNSLQFYFSGIDQTDPDLVTYKWRLDGHESTWNPPSKERKASYPNLPPGSYTFELIACNGTGICVDQPVTFQFTIRPPFWQTLWFYTVVIIAIILTTYYFIKRRERVLIEEKRVLEETVEERTKELREQKEIVELQNEHITEGIEYAKNIQMAILPSEEELNQAFKDHFVFWRPKETVGGDFYWTFQEGRIVWAAAVDCTGHGVSGAFMSMIGSDLLNQIIIEKKVSDPASVLQEMDKGIKLAFAQSAKEFESDQGMDLSLIRIDKKAKKLEFAGALRPVYLVNNGELNELSPDRFPISCGDTSDKIFNTQNVSIEDGMRVYLFSDGFADQFGGPKGKKFMIGKLQKLLLKHQDLGMARQRTEIEKTFADWKGEDFPQIDDVLLMGIEL